MNNNHPLAIAMWDFSWLERRWPGAGYEDWNVALDQLIERGYDAVRIDAYPHLISASPDREWELLPVWNQCDWGSPAIARVRVQPSLNEFIGKCKDRGVKVGLSTWFREDREDQRVLVFSPERHGEIWVKTLQMIESAGLLDAILYVYLCNEWPLNCWAPFFKNSATAHGPDDPGAENSAAWMQKAIETVRLAFPSLSYCFSMTIPPEWYEGMQLPFFDLLEPHLWLATATDFYDRVGYHYERFTSQGYENLVKHGERVYRAKPEYWQAKLRDAIQMLVRSTAHLDMPLVTTECWGVVDYKDWPMLDWGWVKELTAYGVEEAVASGRWKAMATSNFCGPQFHGMWRDIGWHRRLTDLIHHGRSGI